MQSTRYDFIPERYEQELAAIISELLAEPVLDADAVARAVKRHPKDGRETFSKSEIIRGFRRFAREYGWEHTSSQFIESLRAKPVRTVSGVAPVTVLTKPFPCPGECVFCPNDVRMPKSYLSMEPGAQRAAQHGFDPYGQTYTRLRASHNNGHRIDKVELIILGGTWSFYPEAYQVWFVKRCFDAMNEFFALGDRGKRARSSDDFMTLEAQIDGRTFDTNYNVVVSNYLKRVHGGLLTGEEGAWTTPCSSKTNAATTRRPRGARCFCSARRGSRSTRTGCPTCSAPIPKKTSSISRVSSTTPSSVPTS
jgi:hypothetical protein